MTLEEGFLEDLQNLPFEGILKAEFENRKVLITFITGNQMLATAPNEKVYSILKEEFLNKLGIDKVIIK